MGTIGGALGDSYFWGIIFTTIIVRTIAWPIYAKQNSTSLKMTLIQPEMEKFKENMQIVRILNLNNVCHRRQWHFIKSTK